MPTLNAVGRVLVPAELHRITIYLNTLNQPVYIVGYCRTARCQMKHRLQILPETLTIPSEP